MITMLDHSYLAEVGEKEIIVIAYVSDQDRVHALSVTEEGALIMYPVEYIKLKPDEVKAAFEMIRGQ